MIGHENILPQHTFFTYDRFAADMAEMPDFGTIPDNRSRVNNRRGMNKVLFHNSLFLPQRHKDAKKF
jgi:hypothetical protein